jgi:hypothetical protein
MKVAAARGNAPQEIAVSPTYLKALRRFVFPSLVPRCTPLKHRNGQSHEKCAPFQCNYFRAQLPRLPLYQKFGPFIRSVPSHLGINEGRIHRVRFEPFHREAAGRSLLGINQLRRMVTSRLIRHQPDMFVPTALFARSRRFRCASGVPAGLVARISGFITLTPDNLPFSEVSGEIAIGGSNQFANDSAAHRRHTPTVALY